MKPNLLALLILFFVCEVISLKVITTSYGKLRGITEFSKDNNHRYIFKRVPFAKPPLGELRFALPQKPDPWDGILDASKYSAGCMMKRSMTRFANVVSEDCLYINIFTSEKCLKQKCPVIVYYHGGAFHLDSAVMFPDRFILDRYVAEDVVFAIPAFRLGVFGQLYFGPNSYLSENLLLFDAVLALEYIHNEVDHFGGDPSRVTIMGHSTGGTIVDALGFSSLIDPDTVLFQQIICLSGPGSFGYEELAIQSSFAIAQKLGCFSGKPEDKDDSNIPSILSCLRGLNGTEIISMQRQILDNDNLNFTRIIKGAPFMELGGKLLELKKNTSPRNSLFGTTEHEFMHMDNYVGGWFLDFENPFDVTNYFDHDVMNQTGIILKSDSASVFVSAATYSEAMVNAGANVYVFETSQKPYSAHVTDMQYFIGVHRELIHTSDMDIVDSFYSKFLVNFTKYGVPSPKWEKYDPTRMNYLNLEIDTELGIKPKMKDGFNKKIIDFWLTDMVQLDRNITKQKNKIETSTNNKESMNSQEITSKSSIHSDGELNHGKTTHIYNQWWFYSIIVLLIFIIIFVLICIFEKSKADERQPLISHR